VRDHRWLLGCTLILACSAPTTDATAPPAETVIERLRAIEEFRTLGRDASPRAVLPAHANDPVRVTDGDAWIEVRAVDALHVDARPIEHANVYLGALPSTDLVLAHTALGFEELRWLRDDRAPATARWRIAPGPGIRSIAIREGKVEARDERNVVRISTSRPFAIDARGKRRDVKLRLEGDVLLATLDTHGLSYPIALDPAWTTLPAMSTPRTEHAASLIAGKVLVSGGRDLSTAELFDPATKTWSAAGAMAIVRRGHALVTLNANEALAIGGEGSSKHSSVERYDRTTNTWTVRQSMSVPRVSPAAFVLSGGDVLVLGADSTAERYDPAANTWRTVAPAPRFHGNSTVAAYAMLASGKILVAGGRVSGDVAAARISSVDIYDPTTDAWTTAASMGDARSDHAAVTLSDGKVMIAGGIASTLTGRSTEIYDPVTNTWTLATGTLSGGREGTGGVRLANGRAVVFGGSNSGGLSTIEEFDPVSAAWTTLTNMAVAHGHHTTTLIPGVGVLVAGGGPTSARLSIAELFAAQANGATCLGVSECTSGFCVDSVCCNAACTAACSACDVATALGTCTTVDAALPHGTRTCGGYLCAGGACASSCSADSNCAPTSFCDASACVAKKTRGMACARPAECGSGFCVDGYCCNADCADTCQACDAAMKLGTCSPIEGTPHGTRKCEQRATCSESTFTPAGHCVAGACTASTAESCGNYRCVATGCLTSCTRDEECTTGLVCTSGACVPRGKNALCTTDGLSSIGVDEVTTACAPYRCGGDGTCSTTCAASSQCAPGNVCDTTTKQCVTAAATADDGGCGYAPRSSGGGGAIVVLSALLSRLRRRRSRIAPKPV